MERAAPERDVKDEELNLTHSEDRGSINSRRDEVREREARERAIKATPVPGVQAGDERAPTRTRDMARATEAGPERENTNEGSGTVNRRP